MKVWADGIDITDSLVWNDNGSADVDSFTIIGVDPAVADSGTVTVTWDSTGIITSTTVWSGKKETADEIIDRFARRLAESRGA